MFEQVEGDAVENGGVLRRIASAFAVEVFAEAHILNPVQLVFDAPVLANASIQPRRIGFQAGEVVADFCLCLARSLVIPLCLNAHKRP